MSRTLLIRTPKGTQEINYASLTMDQLVSRLSCYEQKYGSPLGQFTVNVTCEQVGPQEMTDLMDWESLEAELSFRKSHIQLTK